MNRPISKTRRRKTCRLVSNGHFCALDESNPRGCSRASSWRLGNETVAARRLRSLGVFSRVDLGWPSG